MRRWPALLALAATGCGGGGPAIPVATSRPMRVMSVNQCTDQLLLALLPKERIASITNLSTQPGGSLLPDRTSGVATNQGTAEEVLAQRPDLIVAGSLSTPALRGMLASLGYPLLMVDHAASIEDIRRITRQVALAVGEPHRGEVLLRDMDAKFAALARDPGPALGVVGWDRSGFSAQSGTLYDAILTAAGARNLGSDAGGGRQAGLEQLLATDPVLLVRSSDGGSAPSLGDELANHPVVQRLWRGRTVTLPSAYHVCGTPLIADAALLLRDRLRVQMRRASKGPVGRDRRS